MGAPWANTPPPNLDTAAFSKRRTMLPLFSEKNHRVDINPRIRGIHIGSAVRADLLISGINTDATRTSARDKKINTWS